MQRTLIALVALLVLVMVGCTATGEKAQDGERAAPEARGATSSGGQPGQLPGTVGENGEPVSTTALTGEEQSKLAQELLRKGEFEAAINVLEGMAEVEPDREDIVPMLLDAHTGYVQTIAMNRQVAPEALNEVLYSHYMRILELDPEDAEAQAGLRSVRMWYESHAMTLPEEINPLAFLPRMEQKPAEETEDQTEDSGEAEQAEDESTDDQSE